eukprot:3741357-Rhodomonas_salina.1
MAVQSAFAPRLLGCGPAKGGQRKPPTVRYHGELVLISVPRSERAQICTGVPGFASFPAP